MSDLIPISYTVMHLPPAAGSTATADKDDDRTETRHATGLLRRANAAYRNGRRAGDLSGHECAPVGVVSPRFLAQVIAQNLTCDKGTLVAADPDDYATHYQEAIDRADADQGLSFVLDVNV